MANGTWTHFRPDIYPRPSCRARSAPKLSPNASKAWTKPSWLWCSAATTLGHSNPWPPMVRFQHSTSPGSAPRRHLVSHALGLSWTQPLLKCSTAVEVSHSNALKSSTCSDSPASVSCVRHLRDQLLQRSASRPASPADPSLHCSVSSTLVGPSAQLLVSNGIGCHGSCVCVYVFVSLYFHTRHT